jgi:hypothetical protein
MTPFHTGSSRLSFVGSDAAGSRALERRRLFPCLSQELAQHVGVGQGGELGKSSIPDPGTGCFLVLNSGFIGLFFLVV